METENMCDSQEFIAIMYATKKQHTIQYQAAFGFSSLLTKI